MAYQGQEQLGWNFKRHAAAWRAEQLADTHQSIENPYGDPWVARWEPGEYGKWVADGQTNIIYYWGTGLDDDGYPHHSAVEETLGLDTIAPAGLGWIGTSGEIKVGYSDDPEILEAFKQVGMGNRIDPWHMSAALTCSSCGYGYFGDRCPACGLPADLANGLATGPHRLKPTPQVIIPPGRPRSNLPQPDIRRSGWVVN